MDNLVKDVREAERLGYGVHYGHYKVDHPHTADTSVDLEPEPTKRKCKECGEEFEPGNGNQLYCSRKCRKRVSDRASYHRRKVKLPAGPAVCPICGKSFQRKHSQIHCSRSCSATANNLKRQKKDK